MKAVLSKTYLLFICSFLLLAACESGNASGPDDNGDQHDVYEDEGGTTADNTAEVDPPDEVTVDLSAEADAEADPLEDYYWLEGEWLCLEGSPAAKSQSYEVTVKEWNPEKGAGVSIGTLTGIWVQKDNENDQFIIHKTYDDGDFLEGHADSTENVIEYDTYYEDGGHKYHWKFAIP